MVNRAVQEDWSSFLYKRLIRVVKERRELVHIAPGRVKPSPRGTYADLALSHVHIHYYFPCKFFFPDNVYKSLPLVKGAN